MASSHASHPRTLLEAFQYGLHGMLTKNQNPINAESVQPNELHAFAYCLLCVYLSALLDLLKSKHYCVSVDYEYT